MAVDVEVLVERFKQKDIKAFEQLYEMYAQSISGAIYNIVKDEAIVQELLQDTFIKAWNNASTYSADKGRFFTWLMRIARNASFDFLRSKAYKNSRKNTNSEIFTEVLESGENLDSRTDTIGLKDFITRLNQKCKAIIELIYFKGYSQKETSEQLEIPLGTVKTRSRKCLSDLRALLQT
jgi:RNA polymerase sigma-70 factor (ECF subfamily)